jgi:uncharacterized pyridoxamine 5'-phosphate oxidase family protein
MLRYTVTLKKTEEKLKKKLMFAALFSLALLFAPFAPFEGTRGASCAAAADADKAAELKTVYDFLKGCGNYYLATVEGDQPRVRPFSSLALFEGKLYIQTGKIKDVSKQMAANPKIEICAFDNKGTWIRIQAVAVDDPRREPKQVLIDAQPGLEKRYSADDGNTQVLYLKNAIARFHSFSDSGGTKIIEF